MAPEHDEIIRRLTAAFNERDAEAMFADLAEDWESMAIEIDELRDAGEDQIVLLGHLRTRGRATFSERADALRTAGLAT
jgi:hypothetical protein